MEKISTGYSGVISQKHATRQLAFECVDLLHFLLESPHRIATIVLGKMRATVVVVGDGQPAADALKFCINTSDRSTQEDNILPTSPPSSDLTVTMFYRHRTNVESPNYASTASKAHLDCMQGECWDGYGIGEGKENKN
nr:histidine kinase 1-like isoform X2 [Ipomoea batatas]